MARIVNDSKGNKLGSYDGNRDTGTVYDKDGNYAGKYWGHTIYNKDGASRGGYYSGNPEDVVRVLLEK